MESKAYIWGYHHRKYISACAHVCTLNTRQLAALCGFENLNRFQRKRVMWAKGRTHRQTLIPVAFLDAIKIDWDELRCAVDRDISEFDAILNAMPLPTTVMTFGITALGVSIRDPLPQGLSESELYEHIQRIADSPRSHWKKALLTWPNRGMKEVWFFAGRPPREYVYRPQLAFVRDAVDFGGKGYPY